MKLADRRPMADINVTPFVDVVLVLLVIFMLTAPLLGGSVDVDLPRAQARGVDLRDEITITMTREGKTFVNDTEVPRGALVRTLRENAAHREAPRAFVRADQQVPYGEVIGMLTLVREAGVEQVGLITRNEPVSEPRGERR